MTDREFEEKVTQIKWERDTAIKQLRDDYGVGLGEPKDPDVVKVVRCKDCKYSRNLQTTTYIKSIVICTNGGISDTEFGKWDFDFCSYGERKDEND